MDSLFACYFSQQRKTTTQERLSVSQSTLSRDCRCPAQEEPPDSMYRVHLRSPATSLDENSGLHNVVYDPPQQGGQQEVIRQGGFPDSICTFPAGGGTTFEGQSTIRTYREPKRETESMVRHRSFSLHKTEAVPPQSEPSLCFSIPDNLQQEPSSLSQKARRNLDRYHCLLGHAHDCTENKKKSCNRLEHCTVEHRPRSVVDQQNRKRKCASFGHTEKLTGTSRHECQRVKFSSQPDETFDDPHSPILGEEANIIWYQRREYKLMRGAALRYSLGKSDVDTERYQELECFRIKERYKSKKMAIKCIIMASRQWKLSPDDLATIARRVSEVSVKAALLAAAQQTWVS
jgi:hypothetical protein